MLTNVPVITGAEVLSVDTVHKAVHYRKDNQPFKESYDKLVIASGAESLFGLEKYQGVFHAPYDKAIIYVFQKKIHV
ncbi:MAG TPA: hypothetical protein IAB12_01400 [Candidatus Ornithospirochaeta avicola]|uniref:FAD/NAD(P)-binding domain-containing protein n=1 Tax=Candidatus Ornithospirochaeta avicola TaxID=2840896 RepID=A0A9D1PRV9_9SPIO|nr:hypothetical protein [Candidatus Ornithospirochaeta avicola]